MNKYRKSVATFILSPENRLLIVRLIGYRANEWTVPGGGIEAGETALKAAYREIEEEVGFKEPDLQLEEISNIVNMYHFNPDAKAIHSGYIGQQRRQYIFKLVTKKEPTLQPEEVLEYKWIRLEEIDEYFVFPGQAENAKKVLGL